MVLHFSLTPMKIPLKWSWIFFPLSTLSLFLVFSEISAQQKTEADLILHNGVIFTADLTNPYVEALAIKDGKIVSSGLLSEVEKMAGPETARMDLKGNLVIPGINDAHFHLSPTPEGHHLNLTPLEPTWEEVIIRTKEAVKKEVPGTWIFGSIGEKVLLNPQPDRFFLDSISPDHPMLLTAYFGHGYIMNSKAMADLGISADETDPLGGYYERVNGSTKLNGRFYEYADWNAARALGQRVAEEVAINQYKEFGTMALGFGVTSIQNFSMVPVGEFISAWSKSDIPIRMRSIRIPMTTKKARLVQEDREIPLIPFPGLPIRVSGTKWILDGTPIERGAAVRDSYQDSPGNFGRLNFEESEIEAMIRESLAWNDQLLIHSTGDKTSEVVFEAMRKIGPDANWPEKRLRIEHGDRIMNDMIPAAKELGVVVVQNPTHFSIVEILVSRHGINSNFLPMKTLLENGIPLALGSDGPINPFLNIMLAAIHPINPSEAITREQAVRAYTFGSAFAEFQENEKGSLTVGKFADLAVLSQNIFQIPMEALPGTTSILTIINGKVVFDAKVLTSSN